MLIVKNFDRLLELNRVFLNIDARHLRKHKYCDVFRRDRQIFLPLFAVCFDLRQSSCFHFGPIPSQICGEVSIVENEDRDSWFVVTNVAEKC